MSTYTKLIRIGNSLGSRYNRAYLDKLGLKEGDRIQVSIKKAAQSRTRAIAALEAIAAMSDGTLANLDVEAWQEDKRQRSRQKYRQRP